jgi:hypothetical protein
MAERQHGSPEPDRDDEHHEQDRDRQQDIDDAHQRRIDESADQPGNRTVERAHDNRDDRGQETDLQRGLAAAHELAEDVDALVVGTERMTSSGRQVRLVQVGGQHVGVIDERPGEAEQYEEDQHRHADDRQPVARELPDTQPPAAPDRADLTALRQRRNFEQWRRGGQVGHRGPLRSGHLSSAGSADRRPSARRRPPSYPPPLAPHRPRCTPAVRGNPRSTGW